MSRSTTTNCVIQLHIYGSPAYNVPLGSVNTQNNILSLITTNTLVHSLGLVFENVVLNERARLVSLTNSGTREESDVRVAVAERRAAQCHRTAPGHHRQWLAGRRRSESNRDLGGAGFVLFRFSKCIYLIAVFEYVSNRRLAFARHRSTTSIIRSSSRFSTGRRRSRSANSNSSFRFRISRYRYVRERQPALRRESNLVFGYD